MDLPLLALAYTTVLVTELVGDRMLYTVGALGAQYSPRAVMLGLMPAYMLKMLAAVLLGGLVASLPAGALSALTAATFFGTALVIWRHTPAPAPAIARPADWRAGAAVAFAAIFFTEWGDIGQITAATMAARTGAPLIVWIGATFALATKGIIGLTLGAGIRRYVSAQTARRAACVLCAALGILAVARVGR